MVYKFGPTFLPFGHKARVWQTDGQTDRRTDGQTNRILVTRPRLHCMQRGNKTEVHQRNLSFSVYTAGPN